MGKVENHLENILRIMGFDDYEEPMMRRLNIYVATRGLMDNYYSELEHLDLASFKQEIDTFLESLPPLKSDEKNSSD